MLRPCDASQQTVYVTPWGISVRINKEIVKRFARACEAAKWKSRWRRSVGRKGWAPKRIDSYNCRLIRGSSTTYSRHAYAAAFDFFDKKIPDSVWSAENAPPEWFARCFTKRGFTWGGDWTSPQDFPHIEWSSNVPPSK